MSTRPRYMYSMETIASSGSCTWLSVLDLRFGFLIGSFVTSSAKAQCGRSSVISFLCLLLRLPRSEVLLDRLNHLVTDLGGLCEARAEVLLDLLELLSIPV